jgi:hypothetical protein
MAISADYKSSQFKNIYELVNCQPFAPGIKLRRKPFPNQTGQEKARENSDVSAETDLSNQTG